MKREASAIYPIPAAIADTVHSLPKKAPLKCPVAEAHGEQAEPVNLADLLNYDVEGQR